jgi:hypothetical protein
MIPKDIKQVVRRLMLRGLVKPAGWNGLGGNEPGTVGNGKNCRLCGRLISKKKPHECPKAII